MPLIRVKTRLAKPSTWSTCADRRDSRHIKKAQQHRHRRAMTRHADVAKVRRVKGERDPGGGALATSIGDPAVRNPRAPSRRPILPTTTRPQIIRQACVEGAPPSSPKSASWRRRNSYGHVRDRLDREDRDRGEFPVPEKAALYKSRTRPRAIASSRLRAKTARARALAVTVCRAPSSAEEMEAATSANHSRPMPSPAIKVPAEASTRTSCQRRIPRPSRARVDGKGP